MVAYASCDVSLTASTVIRVNVRRNLYAPSFDVSTMTINSVSEAVAPGTVIATVTATDQDQVKMHLQFFICCDNMNKL